MAIPKVGQVWERDGEQRTVAEVEPNASCSFTVRYSTPGTWAEYICSLARWNAWVSKAALVNEHVTNQVQLRLAVYEP